MICQVGPAVSVSISYSSSSCAPSGSASDPNLSKTSSFERVQQVGAGQADVKLSPKRFSTKTSSSPP